MNGHGGCRQGWEVCNVVVFGRIARVDRGK